MRSVRSTTLPRQVSQHYGLVQKAFLVGFRSHTALQSDLFCWLLGAGHVSSDCQNARLVQHD